MNEPPIPSDAATQDRLLRALREARLKLEAAERRTREPIALVGMACRFPGGADDPEAFWRLLIEGRDAVGELPEERDRAAGSAWQDRVPAHLRRGGFLAEIDGFDHRLFGISPGEAMGLDPQQRMLLELSWEALEDAGIDPRSLRGDDSAGGVWVGISNADYRQTQRRHGEEGLDAYTVTGSALSLTAGRLSYVYGLRGPSVALDTACSSSLVALHLAIQSLRSGETNLALVGGVQLILEPEIALGLDRMAALSPAGRCATFDAAADGFVRGEGCAVVVLRRLSDAERRGDPVRAVLLGSAVNQDGASSGLTAPNGTAQREVIRGALAAARLDPGDLDYVEAHGTGTALGDPIELSALADVFAERDRALAVGSVKTNIGHLEAVAGLAGLLKVVLALEHEALPPHLHLERPTAHFDWPNARLEVPTRPLPWPAGERPRTAGISSFGFSGTNAHVIVREAPSLSPPRAGEAQRRPVEILPLAARSEAALAALRRRWAETLPTENLAEICHTARTGRAHLDHRRAWIAGSREELAEALASGEGIAPDPRVPSGSGMVWMFTGQGSQHPGMARGLYESEPVFRRELDRASEILEPRLGAPLTRLIFESDAAALARTGLSQPAIFAVEVALARTWQSWGLSPALVLGHSIGELAAACIAGVFGFEDGLSLIAERGRLMEELPAGGAMLSVLASEERVSGLLPQGAVIAAVNGPKAVTVSGETAALADLQRSFESLGIKSRRLEVSHAFHSPLMASVATPLRAAAGRIDLREPELPIVSAVTGRMVADGEMTDPGYWAEHALLPVRFAEALAAADAAGPRLYLEIGPTATLVGMGLESLPGDGRLWVSSLKQGKDDERHLLEALGRLYVHGVDVDWQAFDADRGLRRVRVPTYAFDRQRFWRGPHPRPLSQPAARTAGREESGTVLSGAAQGKADVDPQPAVLARLLEMLAGIGGPELADLDVHENLFSSGLDSIVLIQARQLISREMGVDVELSRFYDEASTLDRLAAYVVAHAAPERLPGAPAAAVPPPAALPAGEVTVESIAAQLQALGRQLEGLAASPVRPPKPAPVRSTRPASAVLPNRPGRSASGELAERQRRHLEDLVPRYERLTGASKRLAERYRPVFASSRGLAGFRPEWKELVYQIAGGRGEGARIHDADGREYRDFTMGFGAELFGHSPSFVREALTREIERGMPLGPLSDLAGETAERVCALTGVDRVAFFNSGSEAVMSALRIARTVAGRPKIALFEGSYHGMFDGVLALGTDEGALPISPGTPQGMVEDVIVLPYHPGGEAEALEIIERHAGELAAVLVEPVQSRRPNLQPRDFVLELRRLTERRGIALILDEMITGFRCHPGGIQGRWGVQGDIVTYGKIVGGGMPVGAVAGKARFLDAVDGGAWRYGDASIPKAATTFTSGTFCNHPLTMAAGGAVLARLQAEGPALQARLDDLTERMCRRLDALFQAESLPLHMAWFSSLFRFVFEADLELLFFHLLARGFYVWEGRNCFLSTAHTEDDVDAFVAAVEDSLREMRAAGVVPEKPADRSRIAVPGASAAVLPASPAQKRLFILEQMGEGDVAYHLHEARLVEGPLDIERLGRALDAVLARHESLRTGFETVDGEPVQRIHAPDRLPSAMTALDRPGADPKALVPELLQPFDLERPPLLRLQIARLAPERHLFLIDVHHIVCDGLSLPLLVAELMALYQGETLPPPAHQYRDFSAWHLELLASPAIQRQEDYWLQVFDGEVPALDLPADFPRPAVLDFEGGTVRAEIGEDLTRRLKGVAREAGSTLYTVLLAAYQVLLYRLSGQRDLVIGAPVAGRPSPDFDRVVGMFVATLALRIPLDPEASFLDHLGSAARATLGAFDHADYPFERLVEKLALPRDPGRNPLFDTMFEFEVADGQEIEAPGLRFEPLPFEDGTAMFDLDVEVALAGDRLRVAFKYRSRLFHRATAERFAGCFLNVLDAVATDPRRPVDALPLLGAAERRQLVFDWNATAVAFPELPLHGLFEAQALLRPEKIALVDELGGSERTLTYRDLDERSGRLARRLRAEGAGPESFVGIFMERSLELIVAYLGVLKAGAAYVPLDPEYPAQRIGLLLEELGGPLVIAQEHLLEKLPAGARRVVAADSRWGWLEGWGALPAEAGVPGDRPAYALFTSGSTGRPKGVVVPHRAIVNHTLWYVRDLGITEEDTFLQKTVFTFDTSLTEVYAPLASGARLVLPRPREHADPAYVVELIRRYGVTVLEDVPSFTELLADEPGFEECRTLRWHNPGGEALPAALVRRVLDRLDVRMANLYGPTEAAVDSLFEVSERGTAAFAGPVVPIGRPVSNMRAYVLDRRMEPVPVGVAGELYLGGRSLARGYLGRPDLTAERFGPDPLSGEPGSRLYRTGDLTRWLPEGKVVFLGRVDHQVKIRGLRIELGEIEAALAAHDRIETALAVPRPARGGVQLIAYIVPRGEADPVALRSYLKERLPSYMVPSAFVELAALPLTPSGKVDRRALPEPGVPEAEPASARRRPRTPAEEIVAAVFAELLGVGEVGLEDDFFVLGGHSLLATQAVSRLRSALGVALPLRALFESPTVAGVARAAAGDGVGGIGGSVLPPLAAAPEVASYPLSSAQRSVWLACQMQDDTTAYNMAEAYLLEGDLDASALERALAAVVERHEILRTTFFVEKGEPRQRVSAAVPALLEIRDVSSLGEAEAIARFRHEAAEPFDLERGPLLRALLLTLGPRRHAVLFNLHHIVFDAWSAGVLIREVLALYEAPAGTARPLRLQYRDYAVWQTELLASDALAASRAYWHRKLAPPFPALHLPLDKPRPRVRSLAGAQVHLALDPGLAAALRQLGRASGATLFMTLQAAIKGLLFAYTGQRDLAVGTLTAGRFDEALEDQIGFYLGTLVLRDRLDPAAGFLDLLARVRRTTLEAFDHALYPYDRLVSELPLRRSPGRQPLFDVMVNLLDADLTGADLEGAAWTGLAASRLPLEEKDAKFDLTWYLFDRKDRVEITLEYSTDLFEAPTMERLLERFRRLLLQAVERPQAPLADLDLESPIVLPPVVRLSGPPLEPLSPHQERLWFIDRFERGNVYADSPTYHNVPLLLRFEGPIDLTALESALTGLTARHEALRTRLVTLDDRGFQQIEDPSPALPRFAGEGAPALAFEGGYHGEGAGRGAVDPAQRLAAQSAHPKERSGVERLRGPEADTADPIAEAIREALRPFAFEQAPPARAAFFSSALLLTLHHAFVDWETLDVLARDFAELYAAVVENRQPSLSAAPPQPRDLARWQRELPAAVAEAQLLFWRRELGGGDLKALELPTDRPRPAIHTFTAGRHAFRLPGAAFPGRDTEAVLLAAFEAVLHRWAGHDEIVVGTPHSNRGLEGTADLAGPVANLVVLRSFFTGDPSFRDSAAALGRTLERARRNAALPFDRLVLALRPDKDMSRTALFDVLFRVSPPAPSFDLPNGARVQRTDLGLGWGKYDLSLSLSPGESDWDGTLVYNADLFDAPTAERLARHLQTLLQAAAASPGLPVSRLPLLTAAERAALLFPKPLQSFAVAEALHRRFERHAAEAPAAPALIDVGTTLTYGELDRRANRVARLLRRRGVGPESWVGICCERSAAVVVAILGVLKAGGAYLPLDPGYPREHLDFVLADSGARWVLADAASAARLTAPEILNLEGPEMADEPTAALAIDTDPGQAAYLLYTSGSTGRPKGCVVTHRNVARLLDAASGLAGFEPGDVIPLFHSYAFDFSVWEIWGALAHGGRLVVVPYWVSRSPEAFAELLLAEGVTVLNQTPSAFYPLIEQLAEKGTGDLRLVVFGGEALDVSRLQPFFERFGETGPRLVNMYGITETTVHVTARTVDASDAGPASRIGEPLPDLGLFVLDRHFEPQPPGLAGEMWIGGAGLARGYLGRPDLTADRFRPDPFSEEPGGRLYRSGDLGRRRADGDLEYLGRADHQIKVRGFRIEPGEIEAALASHPSVRGALVAACDLSPGDRRLVAYVEAPEPVAAGELRRHLLDRLPPHMVPASFVLLAAFPLTENGKVDREALPAPDRRGEAEGEAVAPRTPAEAVLAEIWQEVLGLERVGIHDDFFALGGDSILSIQILSRAAQKGLALTTQAVFQHPTIAELALAARAQAPVEAEQGVVTGSVLPTPIQSWFFAQDPSRPDHFNQAVLLTVREADPDVLERALEAVALHHDALRLRARRGPEGWQLDLPEDSPRLALERVDLSNLAGSERRPALERHATQVQAGFDLEQGRLAAAVLFQLGGGEPGRLLLAIHHLAVDGVSWRILLADLDAAYRSLHGGEPVRLPAKTTSAQAWARRLHEHAARPEVHAEIDHWLATAAVEVGNPDSGADTVAEERSVTVRLPSERTGQLLGDALRAYGNRVEDLLLAALAEVFAEAGNRGLRVDLEGHGREPFEPGLDLGRTVGWFTALYPVWLAVPAGGAGGGGSRGADPAALLKTVKEQLRAVPGDGRGYGLLRHTLADPRLAALPESPVLFNYHGRADLEFPADSPFGPASESPGPLQDPGARRTHALEITGAVTGGCLEMTWSYSAARRREQEIEELAQRHLEILGELVRHCLEPGAGGYTPSDFPEADFTQEELEDFLSEVPRPD